DRVVGVLAGRFGEQGCVGGQRRHVIGGDWSDGPSEWRVHRGHGEREGQSVPVGHQDVRLPERRGRGGDFYDGDGHGGGARGYGNPVSDGGGSGRGDPLRLGDGGGHGDRDVVQQDRRRPGPSVGDVEG